MYVKGGYDSVPMSVKGGYDSVPMSVKGGYDSVPMSVKGGYDNIQIPRFTRMPGESCQSQFGSWLSVSK